MQLRTNTIIIIRGKMLLHLLPHTTVSRYDLVKS